MKIVTVPNQILRTPTKPVLKVDNKVKKIISDMTVTLKNMTNPKGVGLAANQVGLNISIFLFKQGRKIRAAVNPKIIWHSDVLVYDKRGTNTMLEGCLSIPLYYGTVKRYDQVKLGFLNENGEKCEELFSMPEAVIIQHETDHLNGHLFIDKLLTQKGKLYKVDKREDKEEMVEVEI